MVGARRYREVVVLTCLVLALDGCAADASRAAREPATDAVGLASLGDEGETSDVLDGAGPPAEPAASAAGEVAAAPPMPGDRPIEDPSGAVTEPADQPPSSSPAVPDSPSVRHDDRVLIPAACYEMGSTNGDMDERPPHEVCVSAFFIDRVEVSNARYQECVDAGVCRAADRYPRRPELSEPDRPVVGVGWVDADRYCRWTGMRLPTDAEWELAAGGTDDRRYPWGDEPPSCELAVYARCPPYRTVPVDSYPQGASPYGVLHMAGNAWEWVWDWWSSGYYRSSPRQDPTGPERGGMRSIRGGCWNRSYVHLRVEDRDSGVIGLRNDHVGFRCACSDCGHPPPSP